MRGSAEDILWWKISREAKRYYLHQALRIYHTEGVDRISHKRSTVNLEDRVGYYCEMALETDYLGLLRQYRPEKYAVVQRNIALAQAVVGRRSEAWKAYREAMPRLPMAHRLAVTFALLGGRLAAQAVVKLAVKVRGQTG